MKMLTGLLPPTEGEAWLFGQAGRCRAIWRRASRVGYMSQSFSLYGELTVRQNLDPARAAVPSARGRDAGRASLRLVRAFRAGAVRRHACPTTCRWAYASVCRWRWRWCTSPKLLILDEPTSGVDPIARDQFWELLIDLSRQQGVTIFISTHFMNEAERCDRISLMHAGKVLASDTPAALMRAARHSRRWKRPSSAIWKRRRGEVRRAQALPPRQPEAHSRGQPRQRTATPARFSLPRLLSYAYRETLELRRDPIRLAFALLGSVLLMFVFGFGISLDVEDLRFAVLDRDQSPRSRDYIQNIAGSRYFIEQPPIVDDAELDRRMRNGELALAIEIPAGFRPRLRRGHRPEIGVWVDGAMPYRGETMRGYMQGMHCNRGWPIIREATGVETRSTRPTSLPATATTRISRASTRWCRQ